MQYEEKFHVVKDIEFRGLKRQTTTIRMDALSDLLAPYSDAIAKVAGTITTFQFLSGVFLLNDIRKRGRSDGYPPEPFLGGVVL